MKGARLTLHFPFDRGRRKRQEGNQLGFPNWDDVFHLFGLDFNGSVRELDKFIVSITLVAISSYWECRISLPLWVLE